MSRVTAYLFQYFFVCLFFVLFFVVVVVVVVVVVLRQGTPREVLQGSSPLM